MATEAEDIACFTHIRTVLSWALTQLDRYQVPTEQLAEFIPARRSWGIERRARMVHIGEVWHLGVLLLNKQGVLFEYGSSTRAVAPGHPTHVSLSQEVRREYRDAAHRGGFAEGAVVNFDANVIELDIDQLRDSRGSLFIRDGAAYVRWHAGVSDDDAMLFEKYVAERLDLLINRPAGATD